eukprot:GHRQ01023772.1.p1 GENE.GHRQ01023772.1~~GHRQ01023772.1.p1  ORF type:complete len:105 (+),score=28.77 GHRQ01023772.1:318-632(+)
MHDEPTHYQSRTVLLHRLSPWHPADFMMNLQMLVWGAKHVKDWGNYQSFVDRQPEQDWMHMAVEHARQVRCTAQHRQQHRSRQRSGVGAHCQARTKLQRQVYMS